VLGDSEHGALRHAGTGKVAVGPNDRRVALRL
jgi:hypothetical protein